MGRSHDGSASGAINVIVALGAFVVGLAVIAGAGFARGESSGSQQTTGDAARPATLHLTTAACSTLPLPTLGGTGGTVVAASSNGLYVGIADDASGVSRPVIWRGDQVQRLRVGLDAATPTAVNRRGVVVGTGYDPVRQVLVGWWWSDGHTGPLGVAPGDIAQPAAIDDAGHVVGSLVADEEHADGPGADEDARAAFWSRPEALPTELPALPGDTAAEAFAIAPNGTVGGVSLGSGGTPVWWGADGTVHRLPGLAGSYGVVLGFDARSEPVGQASVPGGTHAVRWDRGGQPSDLGAGLGVASQAVAGAGTAVVGSGPATEGGGAARVQGVIWRGGTAQLMPPLNTPGFEGVQAVATSVASLGAATVVVGFSADAVGLRRPTLWRCSP